MRDLVFWMNAPMGRAVTVALGFAIAIAGIVFFTGLATVVLVVLGMVVLIVGAGLGGPAGVRRRRSPGDPPRDARR